MARCRCAEERCACMVVAGQGITVVGDGSAELPFIITAQSLCVDCNVGGNPGDVLTLYPDGRYRPAPSAGGGGGGGAVTPDGVSIRGNGTIVDPLRVCLQTYDDLTNLSLNCTGTGPTPPPTHTSVRVGDTFADPTVTSQDFAGVDALVAGGYAPQITAAWTPGQFFTVNTFRFYWGGDAWYPGSAPQLGGALPGDIFPTDVRVTAQDATNAAALQGYGYQPFSTVAWGPGQFMTIGTTFQFSWDGVTWQPGAAP